MAGRWYCKISGQTTDPLSPEQLKALADQGKLGPNDLVRHGDAGPWIPAICVKGLMSGEGSAQSLPEATAKPIAEMARRGPAKYAGKGGAKPATPRKAKSLPVARPMDEPPAVPESGKVPPAAARPAPARPAAPRPAPARPAAAAAPSDPLLVNPVTESATHRALGRTAAGARKRQRNNLLAIGILSVLAIGLGVAGVVLLVSRNAAETASADNKTVAEGSGTDAQQPAKQPKTAARHSGSGNPDSAAPRSPDGYAWVDASKSVIRRDDVRVQVLSARIDTPPGEAAITQKKFLLIAVQVQNTSSDKDLRFTSWNSPVPLDEPVRLSDHTGTLYRQRLRPADEEKKHEDSGKPAPAAVAVSHLATQAYQPLPAGGMIEDVLVFEPPSGPVKYLRLSLPAAAFGSKDTLNFLIPGTMIDKGEPRKPARNPWRSGPKRPEPSANTPHAGTTPSQQPKTPQEKLDPGELEGERVIEEINKGADDKEGEGFESMIKKFPKPDPGQAKEKNPVK